MHQVDVCFTESAFISDLSSVPVAVLLQFSWFLARFICFSLPLIALATAWWNWSQDLLLAEYSISLFVECAQTQPKSCDLSPHWRRLWSLRSDHWIQFRNRCFLCDCMQLKPSRREKKALSIYQPINSATVMAGNFQEEYQHGAPSFNDWPDILEKNSWESNHIHDIIWADGHKGELQDEFHWTMNPGNNENIHGDLLGASVENGKHKGTMMIMLVRSVFIPDPDSRHGPKFLRTRRMDEGQPHASLGGQAQDKGMYIYIYL